MLLSNFTSTNEIVMVNKEYLDSFEEKVMNELLRLCTSYNALENTLLATDDIDARWDTLAPEYIADAVKEIANYPTVAVAWAAYLGMAVAHEWDKDWELYRDKEYKGYYGSQGFDDMDENILYNVLKIKPDSKEAKEREDMMRRCAQLCITLIRHENIEPQSPTAFYAYAKVAKTMFRIGAAIELKHMGYKFEKVGLPNC